MSPLEELHDVDQHIKSLVIDAKVTESKHKEAQLSGQPLFELDARLFTMIVERMYAAEEFIATLLVMRNPDRAANVHAQLDHVRNTLKGLKVENDGKD